MHAVRICLIGLAALVAASWVPPRSAALAADFQLSVINTTNGPVEIYWIDGSGQETDLGQIGAQQSTPITGDPGLSYRAKINGQPVGDYTVAGTPGETWRIGAASPPPPPPAQNAGGPPPPPPGAPPGSVQIMVNNFTQQPAEVSWVKPDGSGEAPVITLGAASGQTITSAATHSFVVRQNGQIVVRYTATAAAHQELNIGQLPPPASRGFFLNPGPTDLKVANFTPDTLDLVWTAPDGREVLISKIFSYYWDVIGGPRGTFALKKGTETVATYTVTTEQNQKFTLGKEPNYIDVLLIYGNQGRGTSTLMQVVGDRLIKLYDCPSGCLGSVPAQPGNIFEYVDDKGTVLQRYQVTDASTEQRFVLGLSSDPAVPLAVTSADGLTVQLTVGTDALLEEKDKNAPTQPRPGGSVYQTYFTNSAVTMKAVLPDNQVGTLKVKYDTYAYTADGGALLKLRVGTVDGTSLSMTRDGKPSAPENPDNTFFIGDVKLTVAPRFEASVDTIFPANVNEYRAASVQNTTNWNLTLQANAMGGPFSSYGGGPALNIGASSSKSVNGTAAQYTVSGTDSDGSAFYDWKACGISDKAATTDFCSYRTGQDIYDPETANLRRLDPISLALPLLSTDTVLDVKRVPGQPPPPDFLVVDLKFRVRFDRVWIKENKDEGARWAIEQLRMWRPDQWGRWDAYVKDLLQTVNNGGEFRNYTVTLVLDIRELKKKLR